MLNFIKPMWRGEEKLLFFRAEKLKKTLREKGKSPLPADKVCHSIKPMWQNEEKIVSFQAQKFEKRLTDGGKLPSLADRVWHSIKKVTRIYTMY